MRRGIFEVLRGEPGSQSKILASSEVATAIWAEQ